MAMNQYLQDLLKETKTLIIPGFGALTITNQSTGEIMFMSYLKFDDGTLVKHVAQVEGVDTDEAKARIAKFVNEMTIVLDSGANFQLKNFGLFKKIGGEIVFERGEGSSTSATPPVLHQPVVEAEAAEPAQEKPENTPSEEIILAEIEPNLEPNPIVKETPKSDLDSILNNPIVSDQKTKVEENAEIAAEIISEPVLENTETVKSTDTPILVLEEVVQNTHEPVDVTPVSESVSVTPTIQKETTPVSHEEKQEEAAPVTAQHKSEKKNTDNKEKAAPEKKKTGVFAYILYGIVVIILGAGTYIAINFNDLKKDFPVLADLAGDNEVIADSTKLKELTNENEEIYSDTMPEAEPIPSETVEQPETSDPSPGPDPEPVQKPKPNSVSKPKPVSKPNATSTPKPISKPSSSSKSFPQPDLSKPFHIIAGSFGSEANAKKLASDLKAKGMIQISIGEQGGMYRVSIKGFSSKEDASAALPTVQGTVPSAWIYNWK
jgi:nucleoid DNA-binding protein